MEDSDVMAAQIGMQRQLVNPASNYGPSIINALNPEEETYKFEMNLRNVRQDDEGNIVSNGTPQLNEEGISSVLGHFRCIVSRNTTFSHLDNNEVHAERNLMADALARDLMINRRKYGIIGDSRNNIYFRAIIPAHNSLKRGWEGDDKRFLSKSIQEITSNVNSPKRKQGLFDSINPWKKT